MSKCTTRAAVIGIAALMLASLVQNSIAAEDNHMTHEIHIDWQGPFSMEDVQQKNGVEDFGIYQFYGYHPVYGADTLLYIGKAQDGTFASRMTNFSDHQIRLDNYSTSDKVEIYLGRLAGEETPSAKRWNDEITWAEKLLIYSHTPAWNSKELNLKICDDEGKCKDSDLFNIHVFNWGKHKRLLPEVSGRRYAIDYPAPAEDFKPYTKDN